MQAVGGLTSIASGIIGGGKRRREQREAEKELAINKARYENLDTSNLAANMENTFEDLTVNTQAADFAAQQQNQALANTMSGMSSAAGGSGIAALAQAMAGQQSQNIQKASASIGAQEASNERAKAGGAASVQSQKAAGEGQRQQMELGRDQNILQYRAGQTAGKQQAVSDNNQMIMSGIGDVAGAGMQYFGGMPMKRNPKGKKVKRNKKK